jgi:hypothetical protein
MVTGAVLDRVLLAPTPMNVASGVKRKREVDPAMSISPAHA